MLALDGIGAGLYARPMIPIFDLDDRARLNERFYGEAIALLALS